MIKKYDCVIIGAGTGGTTAALNLAKHGKNVAIIEKDKIGGTCLHRGCIPSKFLAHIRDVINELNKSKTYLINYTDINLKIDWTRILNQKNCIIEKLQKMLIDSLDKSKIQKFYGNALIENNKTILISNTDEKFKIEYDHLIIASGSYPAKNLPVKISGNPLIVTSEEFLDIPKLPESFIIIGAGVIGIEIASILIGFGIKTTIIEKEESILPFLDSSTARYYESLLSRNNIKIIKGAEILEINEENGISKVSYQDRSKSTKLELKANAVLLAAGRKPDTKLLCSNKINISTDKNGFIDVSENLKTSVSDIYAVGDCISTPGLAHQASFEADIAAHNILFPDNQKFNSTNLTPFVIFSNPELAFIGMHEDKSAEKNINCNIIRKPYAGLGRALSEDSPQGQIKLVFIDDKIAGATVIGKSAGEIISLLSVAIKNKMTKTRIKEIIFPHPTISEIIREAIL